MRIWCTGTLGAVKEPAAPADPRSAARAWQQRIGPAVWGCAGMQPFFPSSPPRLPLIGIDRCMAWHGMGLTAGATFILNIMRTKCVDYLDETRGAAAKEAAQ